MFLFTFRRNACGPSPGSRKPLALLLVLALALLTPTTASRALGTDVTTEEETAEESGKADEVAEEADEDVSEETPDFIDFGGALRLNFFHKSWEGQDSNQDKLGDLDVDTFRINVDGRYSDVDISLEYRFYSGYHMLHDGYFGYTFGETEARLGVVQVPFGITPYASHNWFFDIGYYIGLEDDYDAGVKILPPDFGPWNLQLAFFKNDEGSYTGDTIDSARYSYDIVHTNASELGYAGVGTRTNEETNQFNARLTRTFGDDGSSTELGLSAEYGGIYNSTTDETGHHSAVALHLNGNYGRWNVMLQAADFTHELENPEGVDDRFVVKGAYDAPYKTPADGTLYVANVAYSQPVSLGPIKTITYYNDFSAIAKDVDGWEDSLMNVLGFSLSGGALYIYVDAAMGKNHAWLDNNYGAAFAEGDPNADWEVRFNINVGYYF